ncbi:hypothetical protein GGX14DRAFT_701347 [Mycena pura]|uniref:GCM domain-containing protein n=1 Tax=Mycena pura TaxID=153505 RepID=A0AAD6UQL1_9AGAR|nr:hypothetical protein GGX14DRAFT_701347 [Mycena pura]
MFGWLKRLLGLETPPPGAHQPAPPLPGPPWNQYWMQPPYPNQHWMQPTYAYLPPYHPAEPFSNVYPPATVQQDLYPPAAVPHDAAYPRAPQLGWNNYPPYPWPYPPPPVPQNPAPFGHAAPLLPVALPPTSPPVTTSLDSVSPQWPNGNIKIECLTDKKPDDWNDEGWAWRSSGPRVNEIPASAYKSEKHVCLGVFHCNCKANDGSPSRLYRPKKNKAARTNQFSETCHLCRGNLKQIACLATLMSYKILDDDGNEHTVRQHSYYHNHPRPPTKRLAAADIDALDQEVRKNPHLTAQQLRAGTGTGQMALGEINPVLLDSRKARHEVDKSKIRQGIAQPTTTRNAGFQLLDLARKIHESFDTPWIVKSELLNGQFIVMQTPFMHFLSLRYLGDHIHMGHYTTRIKLNNLAYEYDDTRDGGKLRELGPVEVLEHFDIHVAYALYLRTSEEAISTRLATDIQVDFAKIPPSTIDDTLLSRSPSPVSPEVLGKIKANGDAKRSTEQDSELNFEMDLEKDINQLLLESITISKPSHLTRRVRFSSDSPPPEIETLLGSSESGTPAPLKCTGCRERAAETTETQSGDPEGGVDWDADDVSFICQFCDPKLQPGASIVVFPLPPDSDISDIMCIWYPAIFVQRQADMDGEADEFEFKWSSLIDSDAADGAFSVSKSVLQAVMSATVSDSQIGCLSVPKFMNISLQPGDDFLKLLALFAMALDEVAHILVDFKTSHPVIEHYANFKAKARKAKKKSSHAHWVASLGFPVDVPELEALTIDSKLMRKLQTHSHLTENLTPGEIADRVSGPGLILLQLLYIQHQIGEPYNLNGDLFRDLNDGVVRGDNKLYYTLPKLLPPLISAMATTGSIRDADIQELKWQHDQFEATHVLYKRSDPLFRRQAPSPYAPTAPISISIPEDYKTRPLGLRRPYDPTLNLPRPKPRRIMKGTKRTREEVDDKGEMDRGAKRQAKDVRGDGGMVKKGRRIKRRR